MPLGPRRMPDRADCARRARQALRRIIIAAAAALAGAAHAACPPDSRIEEWVLGNGRCLALSTFGAEAAGAAPVLVIVVHGDISDGGRATYHVAFAKSLARPGVVAVALTRPGYADDGGRLSEGSNHGRIDNYTPRAVAAVARAVAALKAHYRPRRVIYVGHSGGAAIGGVLIGQWPRLVDAAVLASCPCDIPRWLRERKQPPWTQSLSPSSYVARVPRNVTTVAVTGTADANTFPALGEDYAARLARRGVDARFVAVEGAGHGFSGVAEVTARIVGELAGSR
jgi:pimeloyl-ACP methyl ester carboxylesterase